MDFRFLNEPAVGPIRLAYFLLLMASARPFHNVQPLSQPFELLHMLPGRPSRPWFVLVVGVKVARCGVLGVEHGGWISRAEVMPHVVRPVGRDSETFYLAYRLIEGVVDQARWPFKLSFIEHAELPPGHGLLGPFELLLWEGRIGCAGPGDDLNAASWLFC